MNISIVFHRIILYLLLLGWLSISSAPASVQGSAEELSFPHQGVQLILLGYDQPAVDSPINLALDDGSFDDVFCTDIVGQYFTWNRFTPDPGDFPFNLRTVSILLNNIYAIGDPVQVLVYSDPDSNVTNGASLVKAEDFTIQSNNPITWNVFTFTTPAMLNVPGDVLVGIVLRVTRTVMNGSTPLVCPAALDTQAFHSRSYMGGYTDGSGGLINPPDPPTIPPSEYGLLEFTSGTVVYHGNLLVRAAGVHLNQSLGMKIFIPLIRKP